MGIAGLGPVDRRHSHRLQGRAPVLEQGEELEIEPDGLGLELDRLGSELDRLELVD